MMNDVYYEITEEGLVFTADAETREEIRELMAKYADPDSRYNWYDMEGDVFEYAVCNGLSRVDPYDIGALTDSPIYSDDSMDDDGKFSDDANFFWYPEYMVSDPIEILMDEGRVVFTKADKWEDED